MTRNHSAPSDIRAPATGHCNCGAVAFEIDGDPAGVFICHCSICRRYTGSNGIAVIVVPNAAFRWIRGRELVRVWNKPQADWQSSFCSVCGSALPGANDAARTFVPAGLLSEGTDALKVIHHVWVDSKAAWDEIGDAGKQHPEAFEAGRS